ncbi:coiled-coil-helix-coiled-coil-helix domain-containing protein 2-like [Thomomys bottae]
MKRQPHLAALVGLLVSGRGSSSGSRMPRGSRSLTSCVAPPASRAPQMRVAPRPAPVAQPPMAAPSSPAAAPQQPALMTQKASTAAGVAVGPSLGYTLGHAITGDSSGAGNVEPARPDIPYQEPQGAQLAQQQQQLSGPCSFEIKGFLECAQHRGEGGNFKLCEGFNEVRK